MFVIPKIRGCDEWGSGAFGAPRGDRKHNGIDFIAEADTDVFSHISGMVTKIGYPYGDDLSFRYVEVMHIGGLRHRWFYLKPLVSVGQEVTQGEILGTTQDLGDRYPGITPHFHYEIKNGTDYIDLSRLI